MLEVQFKMNLAPEQKQQLEFVARHEGRSKGNLIRWLIAERYQQIVTAEQSAAEPKPHQAEPVQAA